MTAEADLRSQAREWLVLLNSGRASAADHAAMERWRRTSAEHAKALAEAENLWALLGQVERPAAIVQAIPRRKRRWPLPLASAASLLLALWLTPPGWHADVRTQAGEIREITLEDGSRLQLNGATALDWNADADGQRRVRLYRGQVDFQVAADAVHPFVIEAGEARVRVTGTRFDVNLLGDQVLLAVSEGHVQVSDAEGRERAVQAGEQIAWLAGRLQSLQPLDAARALAWQRGRLVFRNRPLPEVFEELQRQQAQQVLFLDARARALKVTGVFAMDDPQAVLRAIETALPVKLTRLPGVLLVSSDG
ncbi:FecR domain-containing protein [Pseudomonas chengduensis]|jgi:transmembrane sensor|nr:FecR domain-containing protein [Pseudomonas chengduensis]MDH1730724.1 FecR domain-containing protein [Pseudomonas chengduensis]WKC39695.1 FecR domain-containing protein [Pseudomonas chengduensis]